MSKESIFFKPGIKHVELPWKVIQHVGNQRKMVVLSAFVLFASAKWPGPNSQASKFRPRSFS